MNCIRAQVNALTRHRTLDVLPVHFHTHLIVAAILSLMSEAVPPAIAGPPITVPILGGRLFENVVDDVYQQFLCVHGK